MIGTWLVPPNLTFTSQQCFEGVSLVSDLLEPSTQKMSKSHVEIMDLKKEVRALFSSPESLGSQGELIEWP